MHETEPQSADDQDDFNTAHWARVQLPVWQTVLAGYRLIGEHFVSFALVTLLLATVHFSLMRLVPVDFVRGQISMRHIAVVVGSWAFSSVGFAMLGVGWYRRSLTGERRRSAWFGPRELQFAVAMVLFYLLLSVPLEASQTSLGRSALYVAERLEQSTGYPSDLFWPTVVFLWRVLATAGLFFAFPAIALDARQPLTHGMSAARRGLPSLLLIYLIALVPWFALDKLAVRAMLLYVDVAVDMERLVFVRVILNTWTTTCTLAVAGAAYGALLDRETARRLSADFG